MKTIKYALIGCGHRGGQIRDMLLLVEGVQCAATCDLIVERAEKMANNFVEKGEPKPAVYTDYKKCMDEVKPDAVIIYTAWEAHSKVTMYAIEKGIPVACEVGGAYSLEQLWDLVRAQERYGTPVFLLENCCYGRLELMALNMKRLGVFGEILQCEGAYCHDLRYEVAVHGSIPHLSHYRLEEYKHRNTENYPTHEIGPIAKLLDINCGNRFTYLHSFATKSVGIQKYIKEELYKSYEKDIFTNEDRDKYAGALKDCKFMQGDIITTVIGCQNGETIIISLDTSNPRYYSRRFTVHGTDALLCEDNNSLFIEKEHASMHMEWNKHYNNLEEYYDKYDHRIWKGYKPSEDDGHGGIDFLVMNSFFTAVKENKPMPIDIYDMVTWMAIAPLAEESIITNKTVYFPDFTNGKWIRRKNEFEL